MNRFAKFVDGKNHVDRKEISAGNLEKVIKKTEPLGGWYMNKVLGTFYRSGVLGTYNAIKDSYGDHAPSYHQGIERRKTASSDVVFWLHSEGFVPEKDDFNHMEGSIEWAEGREKIDEDVERIIVINSHIRELKRHNRLLTSGMTKARAKTEFALLPEAIREKYQALIDTRLADKRKYKIDARRDTIQYLNTTKVDRVTDDLAPTKIYNMISSLDEKIDGWKDKEEEKKFEASEAGQTKFEENATSNLSFLDDLHALTSKLVKQADAVDNTNTSPELSDMLDAMENGLNDQDDSMGVDDYNGGLNFN